MLRRGKLPSTARTFFWNKRYAAGVSACGDRGDATCATVQAGRTYCGFAKVAAEHVCGSLTEPASESVQYPTLQ